MRVGTGTMALPRSPDTDAALRRLAHAVLLPGFRGRSVPDWLRRALDEGLGGVVYFAANLGVEPAEGAARLSAALRAQGPDLIVACDQEGGGVARLPPPAGLPQPAHRKLGAGEPAATRGAAARIGSLLRRAGIGLNFAPVLDLDTTRANPLLASRSFGSDPAVVAEHGAAFVHGLRDAGIAAALKHFPGHGDTCTDSHSALPTVRAELATLRARELVPFAAGVAAGAPAVMTGHLHLPALDASPASLSPAAYALLRTELGFTGAAVTDALDMGAVAQYLGTDDTFAAIAAGGARALAAGADLLCLGNPNTRLRPGDDERILRAALAGIFAALADGSLPADRLEQAAATAASLQPHGGGPAEPGRAS